MSEFESVDPLSPQQIVAQLEAGLRSGHIVIKDCPEHGLQVGGGSDAPQVREDGVEVFELNRDAAIGEPGGCLCYRFRPALLVDEHARADGGGNSLSALLHSLSKLSFGVAGFFRRHWDSLRRLIRRGDSSREAGV